MGPSGRRGRRVCSRNPGGPLVGKEHGAGTGSAPDPGHATEALCRCEGHAPSCQKQPKRCFRTRCLAAGAQLPPHWPRRSAPSGREMTNKPTPLPLGFSFLILHAPPFLYPISGRLSHLHFPDLSRTQSSSGSCSPNADGRGRRPGAASGLEQPLARLPGDRARRRKPQ